MKTLNKRGKIMLGIGALVVVAVVAGLVLLGPGDSLFGTTVIHISPQNPTIPLYQAIDMSINSVGNCDWTTSVPNVASFEAGCSTNLGQGYGCSTSVFEGSTKNVKLLAVWPGQSVITAKCAMFTRSTTVTVGQPAPLAISPANPTIAVGGTVKLITGDATCTWSASSSVVSVSGGIDAASVTITGRASGMATIKAQCRSGAPTTMVYVK